MPKGDGVDPSVASGLAVSFKVGPGDELESFDADAVALPSGEEDMLLTAVRLGVEPPDSVDDSDADTEIEVQAVADTVELDEISWLRESLTVPVESWDSKAVTEGVAFDVRDASAVGDALKEERLLRESELVLDEVSVSPGDRDDEVEPCADADDVIVADESDDADDV